MDNLITDKKKILFVCLGNICRSPAAECIMRNMVENDGDIYAEWTVDSAGIGSWHEGQQPDSRMRRHGALRGYDFSSRARQIKPADFSHFDYVMAMDDGNVSDLKKVAPTHADLRKIFCLADFMTSHPDYSTVPDPYYGGDSDFELAIDLIEDGCRGLLEQLKADDTLAGYRKF